MFSRYLLCYFTLNFGHTPVTQPQTAYQNFVSLVSFYSSQRGIVLATQQFETKTTSELTVVQTMLEALHLEDVVFTLDALHTQKKLRN